MLEKRIDPSAGAVIMANGIFLYGGIQAFPIIDMYLGEVLASLLVIVSGTIFWRILVQFFQRDNLIRFFNHPIHSFKMGTWVAGGSVLCNVLFKYFPSILPILKFMAIINSLLWIIFFIIIINSFRNLLNKPTDSVHGVILFSTVGTQSIVILMENLFRFFPNGLAESLIILGLLFYGLGVYLLIKHNRGKKDWRLITDWKNTNCIIHGALSITGLAMVTSGIFSSVAMTAFWLFVLLILVLVEIIEIVRAYKRIKYFGFIEGVWKYDISQWSRNFTFGMFFAFTLAIKLSPSYNMPIVIGQIQESFMLLWAWVVLISLVLQLVLFANSKIER